MERALPAEIGEHIGGYRLERVIAHGGMGCVYVGRHLVLGRPAAIKVLDGSLALNAEYIERFLREARVVNDVRHPNIVDIFDFVRQSEPRRVACIMELLEGPTVEQLVSKRPLTSVQALNVMHQLVGALGKVHSRGVIHRDLKPSNVVVIGDPSSPLATVPSVKILDFGIAKVFTSSAERTGPGTILGTPAYMAPEQVSGEAISASTDVYALGELLYEMLTGTRAFEGSARQVLKLKMIGQVPDIEFPQDVVERERLAQLVKNSLDAEPHARPSLEEFATTLHEVRLTTPTPPPQPALPTPTNPAASEDTGLTTPASSVPAIEPTPVHVSEVPDGVRRLGDYALFINLPPRGMTQSYIARRLGTVEVCLLRRLLRQLEDNETATARFRREALITAHLRHPRIAKLMDARLIEGTFCIASELVLGVSLETLLDRLQRGQSPMPLQVFGRLALATLDALHYAHEAVDDHGRPLGIVHRDLNPSSIAISFSGAVKLQGFGVARASVDDFRTAPGTAVGSLEYMSPEQVRSEEVDRRSDIYTISAVFFEALGGRKLIEPKGVLDTLRSVATDVPPPLTSLRPDIPLALAQVIEHGLAKRRDERFASAEEMSVALAAALGAFASASRDVVGDFVRQVMPDEERNTLDMLAQVRALGEQVSREEEVPHEATMTVRRRTLPREFVPIDPTDANEPDLLTMPGAPAPLETENRPIVLPMPRAPRPSPKNWARLAVVLALGLATVAIVTVLIARRVTVTTTATPLETAGDQPVAAARPAPAPTPGASATPRPPPPAEAAPPPPRQPAPVKRAVTKTRSAAPPPAPPPPPPPPPPRVASPHAGLTRRLAKLRQDSGNVELFDRVHDDIWKAAQTLPGSERQRVKVKLDAAQRTYAVDDLAQALNRLKIAAAKQR